MGRVQTQQSSFVNIFRVSIIISVATELFVTGYSGHFRPSLLCRRRFGAPVRPSCYLRHQCFEAR